MVKKTKHQYFVSIFCINTSSKPQPSTSDRSDIVSVAQRIGSPTTAVPSRSYVHQSRVKYRGDQKIVKDLEFLSGKLQLFTLGSCTNEHYCKSQNIVVAHSGHRIGGNKSVIKMVAKPMSTFFGSGEKLDRKSDQNGDESQEPKLGCYTVPCSFCHLKPSKSQ